MIQPQSHLDKKLEQLDNFVIENSFSKEPNVFNIDNKVKFSVLDLKEFSEKFAKRVVERGNPNDLTGFWDLCKEMFYHKFKDNNETR